MVSAPKTTEETVLEFLGKPGYQFEFRFDERYIRHLVAVLEDPTMSVPTDESRDASPAAGWVRASLLFELGGEVASSVTCDLFSTLGRQSELGWIEK